MEEKAKYKLKIMDKIIAYFYKGERVDLEYKDAASYIYLASVGVGTMWAYSLVHFFKYKLFTLGCIYQATAAFLIIQLFLSKRNKNYQLNFTIGLTIYHIPIFTAAYYLGGGHSPVLFWAIVPILFAKMFGNKKSVYATCFTGVIGTIISAYLWINGYVFSGEVFTPRGLMIYTVVTIVAMTAMILTASHLHRKILDKSLRQVEEKNEQINHFIRILCHDIANPLTIIQARAQMGSRRYLDEEKQQKYFTTIHRASKLINQILEEVRAFEAVSEGKVTVKLEDVSMGLLLEDLDFIFKDSLDKKNLTLKMTGIENYKDLLVSCETETFKSHVINNLISNAIKFSAQDGVIEIGISKLDDHIVLNVKDAGIGIPDDLITKIFDLGEETSRLGTDGERGTGFGLPLVKTYVDLYQGRIEVNSKVKEENSTDHGTSFKISLKSAA